MQLLSFPFRVLPNGTVATVEQGSDQANAEQVSVLILTEIGERPLSPGFGISPPAFATIEPGEIAAGVTEYGPDVEVGDVSSLWDSSSTQLVQVDFSS